MGVDIKVTGDKELQASLESLIKRYPDKAGDLLRKQARELRKDVVRKTKDLTNTSGSSKRSLGKIGSYKVSQVQNLGLDQQVEISAKSPHFHLVEHGHNLVTKNGRTIGFVQGRHMMEIAVKQFEGKAEKLAEEMIDELLKEGGW